MFLIEAAQVEPGAELSAPVAAGMERVLDLIEERLAGVGVS